MIETESIIEQTETHCLMDPTSPETTWIWHPGWTETVEDTAGGFVHFRKSFTLQKRPEGAFKIHISADTRYKLYANSQLVSFGPVKGDQHLWFYDEIDVGPYLKTGLNHIAVRVLRLYYATGFATSFPRLPYAGLMIRHVDAGIASGIGIQTDSTWETALDLSTRLPVDLKEDDFLHTYEDVNYQEGILSEWVPSKILHFPTTHGLSPPWKLSPRQIPYQRLTPRSFKAIHNVESTLCITDLEKTLLNEDPTSSAGILFKAGTRHHIELEANEHLTAFLSFRFDRPTSSGSTLCITYSECYEDEPVAIPYLRKKGDRCDTSKRLLGPQDVYKFGGKAMTAEAETLKYGPNMSAEETFFPFHFRTFRFLTLDVQVADDSDLLLKAIQVTRNNYPLDVRASFEVLDDDSSTCYQSIWSASLRTLSNCLHDCYEDCPFYEQLQYAMDTRSSILFTYAVSRDDRLARQAITQFHDSYLPSIGLTASRTPAHQLQIIPHFSLFWVLMVADHLEHFGDVDFARTFIHTCDGVLETFARWVDPELGLVHHDSNSPHWFFVDWTDSWRPMGIPPAGERTGYLSYTNMLYAYTLKAAARICLAVGRTGLAEEYDSRAKALVESIRMYCFDGQLFTDGLASKADTSQDYSQHSQIWAVLSGAASPELGVRILEKSLSKNSLNGFHGSSQPISFSPASTAMSFYALRALSVASFDLYNRRFHQFWEPWRTQLSQNLTTWEEDTVSQRSDCHAWGCAALYEFMAEVAGIQPGAPGWSKIIFRPRLSLFLEFKAAVPFGGKYGRGLAHVEWRTVEHKDVQVSLRLEMDGSAKGVSPPPVEIGLPDGNIEVVENAKVVERRITLPG